MSMRDEEEWRRSMDGLRWCGSRALGEHWARELREYGWTRARIEEALTCMGLGNNDVARKERGAREWSNESGQNWVDDATVQEWLWGLQAPQEEGGMGSETEAQQRVEPRGGGERDYDAEQGCSNQGREEQDQGEQDQGEQAQGEQGQSEQGRKEHEGHQSSRQGVEKESEERDKKSESGKSSEVDEEEQMRSRESEELDPSDDIEAGVLDCWPS
ncbi:hypothetical protein BDY21DRAFT_359153 [Lineolata rhizophorae]|uniref:Uncharacterized protein n=1 Tax=Lineolata rhizophorae TaxID=578093 RepID=A0A6A6NL48_9PEZI|nr:hypothetical protein BDY21DRAFT_359153 [Lineolata rhizophorae]